MTCHHIDWSGLQIKVSTTRGQLDPDYFCILCQQNISPKDYKHALEEIKKHVKDNTLRFFRTPKGKTHDIGECVEEKKCPIHGAVF